MRGVLKYTTINDTITDINNVITKKYKIMDTPLNKMKSEEMRMFQVPALAVRVSVCERSNTARVSVCVITARVSVCEHSNTTRVV